MSTNELVDMDDMIDVSSEDEEKVNMGEVLNRMVKRIQEDPDKLNSIQDMNKTLTNLVNNDKK